VDRLSKRETNTVNEKNRFCGKLAQDRVAVDEIFSTEQQPVTSYRNDAFLLRQAKRHLLQISVAAATFSQQLDFRELMREIARQGYEILRADQVIVYSNVDGRLQWEATFPISSEETQVRSRESLSPVDKALGGISDGGEAGSASEANHWCAKYLRSKICTHFDSPSPAVQTTIHVPFITTQNRVLGVVEFRNKRTGGVFTEHDLQLAECLSQIATSAIDRARLFYRMEEWQRAIETLLSFNATVNQHLEPEEMVRELVANVTGFLEADGGVAGIVIRDDTGLIATCDSFYFDGQWFDYRRRWRAKEGIPGIVLETEFPFLINDYQLNEAADPYLVDAFGIGSCICVPIKNAGEEVLGFFKLHRRSGQPEFSWQDAAFLESLGNTAAVAIENARLMKSLEMKNAQIKKLSQDHVRRLEMERQHIARELHDETGQVLIGLKLRLQVLAGLLTADQSDAKQELSALRMQVNDATAQLKDLAKRLRPPTLDELGFEATLRQLVAEFRRQVDFGIRLEIQSAPLLPSEAETALYRIAQESLTNVAKHAGASQVVIKFFRHREQQVFSIHDNGRGFDVEATTSGLGLIGIHERVKMLGGKVRIESRPEFGTQLDITIGALDSK
jgi:signal transduction histidine kinase